MTAPTSVKCEVTAANALPGSVPAGGITSAITVTTTRDCTWTAASNAGWLTLGSSTSGQGSGSIEYRVAANGDPAQRRAAIDVNNTQIAVVQDAAPCRFGVSPTSTAVSAVGGAFNITLDTLAGCAWTAASDSNWITISANASGNRAATIAVAIAPNTGPLRRGTIKIGDAAVSVEQAAFSPSEPPPPPEPCSYTITPTMQNMAASDGDGTITVTAGAGCTWTATANAAWITITSGATGSGNGAVAFHVTANPGAARTTTMVVAGRTATITQAAAPCTYSLDATSQSMPPEGGVGTVGVTAGSACSWSATSNTSWISITQGASGTGNGSVQYSVAVNSGTAARAATITIAGRPFTVTQAGAPPPCTFTLSPPTQNIGEAGGRLTVTVTASASTCAWTASSQAAWITVTNGGSGSGNGTVELAVAANTGASRTGTVTIGGQTFSVTQAAAPPPCTFTIAPPNQNLPSTGGSGSVTVTASAPTCAWTATSNAPWLTISSGASGTGNGTVTFNAAANTGPTRTGTLTVAGQTFTVNQAAPPPPCTYSVSPASQSVPAAGGVGSIAITASDGSCSWTAAVSSGAAWITITSAASGTGSGTVAFRAAPNSGPARSGAVTIAGQTAAIMQPQP